MDGLETSKGIHVGSMHTVKRHIHVRTVQAHNSNYLVLATLNFVFESYVGLTQLPVAWHSSRDHLDYDDINFDVLLFLFLAQATPSSIQFCLCFFRYELF